MTRTDIHRPSQIIPSEYEYVFSYALASTDNGFPVPSQNIRCEGDHHAEDGTCCVIGLRTVHPAQMVAVSPGRCTVCGTPHIYGDVWQHTPTGEYIAIGHVCAGKYSLLADRTDWELQITRARRNAAVQAERARKADQRTTFLAEHPGLEEALAYEHHITADIAARFTATAHLSEKQIALVLKLAREGKERAERPEEKHVPAPTGRTTFRGRVVSWKLHESDWGTVARITVKVETPDGVWLAWGTCPSALYDTENGVRGALVEITATLTRGNDEHFAFMKRPRGTILEAATAKEA